MYNCKICGLLYASAGNLDVTKFITHTQKHTHMLLLDHSVEAHSTPVQSQVNP